MGGERNTCGHPDKPYAARGLCRNCYARDQRERKAREDMVHRYPPDVAEVHVNSDGSSMIRILDMARFVELTPARSRQVSKRSAPTSPSKTEAP